MQTVKKYTVLEQLFGVIKEEACGNCKSPCVHSKQCYQSFEHLAQEIHWKFIRPLETYLETANRKVWHYEAHVRRL